MVQLYEFIAGSHRLSRRVKSLICGADIKRVVNKISCKVQV